MVVTKSYGSDRFVDEQSIVHHPPPPHLPHCLHCHHLRGPMPATNPTLRPWAPKISPLRLRMTTLLYLNHQSCTAYDAIYQAMSTLNALSLSALTANTKAMSTVQRPALFT